MVGFLRLGSGVLWHRVTEKVSHELIVFSRNGWYILWLDILLRSIRSHR